MRLLLQERERLKNLLPSRRTPRPRRRQKNPARNSSLYRTRRRMNCTAIPRTPPATQPQSTGRTVADSEDQVCSPGPIGIP